MRTPVELDNPFIRGNLHSAVAAGTMLAAPMSILCVFFGIMAASSHVPIAPLIQWGIAISFIAAARLYVAAAHIRKGATPHYMHLLSALTLAQGIAWGLSLYIIPVADNVELIAIITLIVTGISIGSMMTQIATPHMWMLIFGPSISLHSIYLFTSSRADLFTLGALCLIFAMVFALSSVRLKKYLDQNVRYQSSLKEKNQEILEKNDRLYKLAHYDGLTGGANRKLLVKHASKALEDTAQRNDTICAFFHIDLDHFKHLNDTMGHAAGDELLRIVCTRLQTCVRKNDIVARLGGDEFGVFASNLDTQDDAEDIAHKIITALERPQRVQGAVVNGRASMGVALFPRHGSTISELMNNSDLALQAAKKNSRGGYRVCTDDLQLQSVRKMSIESDLRRALRKQSIGYQFQPIVRGSDQKVTGVEALLRVRNMELVTATVEDLVETSARVGLADELSAALFKSLEEQAPGLFAALPDLEKISVNLSPVELRSMKPVERFEQIFERGFLTPDQIQIEITEQSVLERGADQARKAIDELSKMGLSIVVDDFGTGYSSLSHLKTLPISGVKIDKSFIHEMVHDVRDAAIVRSLVGMCKGMGLSVTAEGIEDFAQFDALRRLGCDYMQGYLFYKAGTIEELQGLVAKRTAEPASVMHLALQSSKEA